MRTTRAKINPAQYSISP